MGGCRVMQSPGSPSIAVAPRRDPAGATTAPPARAAAPGEGDGGREPLPEHARGGQGGGGDRGRGAAPPPLEKCHARSRNGDRDVARRERSAPCRDVFEE